MAVQDPFRQLREEMIETQLRARGVTDARVLHAMLEIPRHEFVPQHLRGHAYVDGPLPIGEEQTISQPFIVGAMLQAVALTGTETVLEIGTGSGYQTALLSRLCRYVYTLERLARLADNAGQLLLTLNCANVDIHVGDGSQGLPDMSPFDAILVTAAAPHVPGPLCTQLSPHGGRMVIPVGEQNNQKLQLVTRNNNEWHIKNLMAVRFVPLLGRYGFDERSGSSEAEV